MVDARVQRVEILPPLSLSPLLSPRIPLKKNEKSEERRSNENGESSQAFHDVS